MAAARKPNPLLDAGAAAEAKRRLAVLDSIESILDASLGESWTERYEDAAGALRDPNVVRVLGRQVMRAEGHIAEALGLVATTPVKHIVEVIARRDAEVREAVEVLASYCPEADPGKLSLRGAVALLEADVLTKTAAMREDLEMARELLSVKPDCGHGEPVATIDTDTPEGILEMLDAATTALLHRGGEHLALIVEHARDSVADVHGLPLANPGRFAAEARRARSSLGVRVENLTAYMSATLASRIRRTAALLDDSLASHTPESLGHQLSQHCEDIAAYALALKAKIGGAK